MRSARSKVLGFRVQGSGFRWPLKQLTHALRTIKGFGVWGLGFRVFGFQRLCNSRERWEEEMCRVQDVGHRRRVVSLNFRVWDVVGYLKLKSASPNTDSSGIGSRSR